MGEEKPTRQFEPSYVGGARWRVRAVTEVTVTADTAGEAIHLAATRLASGDVDVVGPRTLTVTRADDFFSLRYADLPTPVMLALVALVAAMSDDITADDDYGPAIGLLIGRDVARTADGVVADVRGALVWTPPAPRPPQPDPDDGEAGGEAGGQVPEVTP